MSRYGKRLSFDAYRFREYLLRKEKLQGKFLNAFPSTPNIPNLSASPTSPHFLNILYRSPTHLGYSPDDHGYRGGTHGIQSTSTDRTNRTDRTEQAQTLATTTTSTPDYSIPGRSTTMGSSLPVSPALDLPNPTDNEDRPGDPGDRSGSVQSIKE
jgi:hypothetical protein